MNRRHFLHTTGGVMAGMALGSGRPAAAEPSAVAALPLKRIGLELWSVRKAMAKDFDRTLAAVRQIGYTDVELLWSMNNFGRSTAEVKAALQREGLRAPSAHITPLIVPSLTDDTSQTLDQWREWADHFNTAGAVARKHDIWLAFHNEAEHMKPI